MNINEILESCLLIVEAKARDKNIVLETTIAPDLPNFHADPLRLKQILINLLSNAVKFTPAGGRVELDITRSTQALAASSQRYGHRHVGRRDRNGDEPIRPG